MKKILLSLMFVCLCSSGFAQEECEDRRRCRRSSPCATRDASVLSMMGWGVTLFAGIAILCSLIDSNPAPTTTTTTTQ
ncbi:MAG TPA: hypothetical protein VLE96_06930 [Chlamydiales bacterium]|nr:hypothetical protein [Chlamydiales bacterium]